MDTRNEMYNKSKFTVISLSLSRFNELINFSLSLSLTFVFFYFDFFSIFHYFIF